MTPIEREYMFREIGQALRRWVPEAADYLESYKEPTTNAEPGAGEERAKERGGK
jgi:hypothetical protein